jgi:hypothetical protein
LARWQESDGISGKFDYVKLRNKAVTPAGRLSVQRHRPISDLPMATPEPGDETIRDCDPCLN